MVNFDTAANKMVRYSKVICFLFLELQRISPLSKPRLKKDIIWGQKKDIIWGQSKKGHYLGTKKDIIWGQKKDIIWGHPV